MNKTTTKQMFAAIQNDDTDSLNAILDSDADALETVGEHNRNVRDKTPLMFAMQCSNLRLAHELLDRGANAASKMAGGHARLLSHSACNLPIATPIITTSGYDSQLAYSMVVPIRRLDFGRR